MLAELIATGFFAGKSKIAPGTVGTLVGIPFVLLASTHWFVFLTLVVLLGVVGTLASQFIIEKTGIEDPEEVVVDEILGFLLAFILVPISLKSIMLGFLIFRVLDIVKPFPIKFFEKLPGAFGVMADDIVAGVMTAVILWVIFSIL